MGELFATQIAVPLSQVSLLLGISTLALLFGRLKLALIVNYCFTFYWGSFLNPSFFSDTGEFVFNNASFAYFGFGLLIIILAVIGFFFHKE